MQFIKRNIEILVVIALLIVSGLTHGINMLEFPYFENDEAVYVSQAWAVTEHGKLAPYTYWYDHAPGGWIFIGLWAKLTGGYFAFGESINSGRIFMLLLHLASTYFLYFIGKRLTGNRLAGIIAALLFSLSPLGIHFQRRVLLDNIMVFWTLLSAVFILISPVKLRHILLSGLCLGIAILSKETAVFFIPAFIFLLYKVTHPAQRLFGIFGWLTVTAASVSIYPLYALIRSEFFSYGTYLGGDEPHVSLLETLGFQASRPGGSIFEPETSLFWQNMDRWIAQDWFIIVVGIISTALLFAVYTFRKKSLIGFAALLSIFSLLFLVRGGVVIEFYVVPMIPFFALTIGILCAEIINYLTLRSKVPKLKFALSLGSSVTLVLAYLIFGHNYQGFNIYTANQVQPQLEALEWIRNNAETNDYIITDNYLWLDLNAPDNPSAKVFPNAEWYWKVERDPEIKNGVFGNSTDKTDFIIETPQVTVDSKTSGFEFISKALTESRPIVRFDSDDWSVIIWGHRTPAKILKRTWVDYKENFIDSDGRVANPEKSNEFTAQAQSYALLRAVWMNDHDTFDRVWGWTETNLQQESGIFSSVYNETTETEGEVVVSATDADQDIALALIFASKLWNDSKYAAEAQQVLDGIWVEDIVEFEDALYVTAGNWAETTEAITLNPSYLSPAWYRVFDEFDSSHAWSSLVATSYEILDACSFSELGSVRGVLPPDWCEINTVSGEFEESKSPRPMSTDYSYDALRTTWRIALDHKWYQSTEAVTYLRQLDFIGTEYRRNNLLYAAYKHNGAPRDLYEFTAAYAGSMGYFKVVEPELADIVYQSKIAEYFYENATRSYWQDAENYYTQNWAWFGTALYGDLLPNLWISLD